MVGLAIFTQVKREPGGARPLEAMAVAAEHFGELGRLLPDAGRKRVNEVLQLHGEQMARLQQLLEGGGV